MPITIGKPSNVDDSDEYTALHEAGHVAVACCLNLEVSHSRLDGSGRGETGIYADMCPADDYRWALIACAGAVAEGAHWINDDDFAAFQCSNLTEDDLPRLFDETKAILDKCKPLLRSINDALLKHRKLSDTQVKRIFVRYKKKNHVKQK
jgi:hypothetical protein